MCSGDKCANDYKVIHTEAYIQMFYIDSYVDNLDYNNPVKKYLGNLNQQITDTLLKRAFITIVNDLYISDNGWMIEDKRQTSYYSLDSTKIEINNISQDSPGSVYWITLESSYLRTKNVRNYMKVQDLFAKIGGIVNAFIIIIQIFFSHYFRYNMIMSIRKFLNPSKNDIVQSSFNSVKLSNRKIIKNNLKSEGDLLETNKDAAENNSSNKINLSSNADNLLTNNKSSNQLDQLNNNDENCKKTINVNMNNYINNQDMPNIRERLALKKLIVNYKNGIENKYFKSTSKSWKKNETSNKEKSFKSEKFDEKNTLTNKNTANFMNAQTNVEEPDNKLFRSNTLDLLLKKKLIDNNSTVFENYEKISFQGLSYFDFIMSLLCCNKRKRNIYFDIRDEINELLDIYSFSAFMHINYRKLEN